ncbi:MAG: hypothetical protein ACXABD_11950 [Candidatus Thorarchaeota archaeon]|jgi:hypothetical protein
MTWHLKKVPKLVHYFWDNRPLSFLRWMSMHSFSALNPDWTLKLHITTDQAGANWSWTNNKQQFEAGDYRRRLHEVDRLEIVEETDFPGIHGVHQSDILRNRYLSEEGGLWSDVDIIYCNPMAALFCNVKDNAEYDTGLCRPGRRWFPIAFMLAAPGSPYFRAVHQHQCLIHKASGGNGGYQKFGTKVYEYIFQQNNYPYFQIDKKEVYQHGWNMHASLFAGNMNINVGVGIHWYGGSTSAATAEPRITHKNWRDFPIKKAIEVTL